MVISHRELVSFASHGLWWHLEDLNPCDLSALERSLGFIRLPWLWGGWRPVGLCSHMFQCENWDWVLDSRTPRPQNILRAAQVLPEAPVFNEITSQAHNSLISKSKTCLQQNTALPWALSEGTHGHVYALSLCSNFSLSIFPPTFLFWWNLFCLYWLLMQPYLSLVKSVPSYGDLDWGSGLRKWLKASGILNEVLSGNKAEIGVSLPWNVVSCSDLISCQSKTKKTRGSETALGEWAVPGREYGSEGSRVDSLEGRMHVRATPALALRVPHQPSGQCSVCMNSPSRWSVSVKECTLNVAGTLQFP